MRLFNDNKGIRAIIILCKSLVNNRDVRFPFMRGFPDE